MKTTKFNNIGGNVSKVYEGKKGLDGYWVGMDYLPYQVGFNRILSQVQNFNPTTNLFENVDECVQFQNYMENPKNIGLAFGNLFSEEKWVDFVLPNDSCITVYYSGSVEVIDEI